MPFKFWIYKCFFAFHFGQHQLRCVTIMNLYLYSPWLILCWFYASSPSKQISGTIWSVDDFVKSRLSSTVIHGCSKISSDRIRSSGSLRSSERIMHRAFDVKHSGTRNWPRDIFANNDACSESLNGYLSTMKMKEKNINLEINGENKRSNPDFICPISFLIQNVTESTRDMIR